jgi:hypothetical protein
MSQNIYKSTSSAVRSTNNLQPSEYSAASLRIVKTDVAPTGEAIQLVRPMAQQGKTTEDIVGELVNKYDYKKRDLVNASE